MDENPLIPYFNNEKIVKDLCAQLTKDLAVDSSEIQVDYPFNNAFEQLYQQILPIVLHFQKENKSKLNFILNRCDISEQQLKSYIQKNKTKEYAELITELIIKRDLQKIVIRNMQV